MINKYGLKVSSCIVHLWMGIGRGFPKYSPVNMVEDCEYMFPMRFMESLGYPKYFIMASSLAWLMEPKAFFKSKSRVYISWFVNFAFLSVAISNWICLEVFLSALNPSWLSCNIWYFSPYAERIDVNVIV